MNKRPIPLESISCRVASCSDLPMVQALLMEHGLPYEDIGAHIEHFVLVWANGALIASAGVELLGTCGLLRSVCVTRNRRNRGLAVELCLRIETCARNAGVSRLYLLTTTAKDYFERRGYSVCLRESLPTEVKGTAEFRALCPASAVCMVRCLG